MGYTIGGGVMREALRVLGIPGGRAANTRDEHSPQIGLTGSVRDFGGKIDLTIGSKSLERHAILAPPGDSFIPRLLTRWRSIGWPVIFRPLQLFLVVGVLKELEQIVLRDANVLEQLPR